MINPGRYDPPVIWRGLDWPEITMVWKDLDGNPFDLTGWQPFAETINGIPLGPQLVDPVNGVTKISMIAAISALAPVGRFHWDWVWSNTILSIRYPPTLTGIVTVKQPNTHIFYGAPGPPPSPLQP